MNSEHPSSLKTLLDTIARLRHPTQGCPWDIKQTHESLKPYLIEESYETVDAIDIGPTALKMELGDVLLQVVLHAQIASENGDFTFHDIVETLTQKLIYRHPHVFDEKKESLTEGEVLSQWERLKGKERKDGILSGVPEGLPALLKAQRVSEKAARVGFEWDSLEGVKDKILEEIKEFCEARMHGDTSDEVHDEFGDVFFALVQLARRLHLDAETCLQRATNKFITRFNHMEAQVGSSALETLTLSEFEKLWRKAKDATRN
jgi:MazG family protein